MPTGDMGNRPPNGPETDQDQSRSRTLGLLRIGEVTEELEESGRLIVGSTSHDDIFPTDELDAASEMLAPVLPSADGLVLEFHAYPGCRRSRWMLFDAIQKLEVGVVLIGLWKDNHVR